MSHYKWNTYCRSVGESTKIWKMFHFQFYCFHKELRIDHFDYFNYFKISSPWLDFIHIGISKPYIHMYKY